MKLENKYKFTCRVNFTRKTPFNGPGYLPHLVVSGDEEYKGVRFLDALVIGENSYVRFEPIFPDVNYQPFFKIGTEFEIKEGKDTVGTGQITFVRDKYCSQ